MSGHSNQSCDMTVRGNAVSGLHFGFLAPWAQQNNWDYWDIPWVNTKEKVDVFRAYANLRYRLVPYLYGTAANAARTGLPMVRALPLVHPDVKEYDTCTGTYYLGDNLLVGVYHGHVLPGRQPARGRVREGSDDPAGSVARMAHGRNGRVALLRDRNG